MKCAICGHEMIQKRESFHDTLVGLPHVTIVGADVRRCPSCGEYEVSYPEHSQYLRTIAREVLGKGSRLTGEEIRYLRKHVDWSGVELAKHMGISAEAISRWENGREVIGPTTDRLLRLVIAMKAGLGYEVAGLVGIEEAPVPARIVVQHRPGVGWARANLPRKVGDTKDTKPRPKRTKRGASGLP
jgi:putative zinc finger/helix-turn-helix YgiT family protein